MSLLIPPTINYTGPKDNYDMYVRRGLSMLEIARWYHGPEVNYRVFEQKFHDGCDIRIQTFDGVIHQDIINIKAPGEKKEAVNTKKIIDWVMLLSIVNVNSELLGVLVVNRSFSPLIYIKNTGSDAFSGFDYWGTFYGFTFKWGSEGSGRTYYLEELPRRSENDCLSQDQDEGSSTYDDSDWEPGPDPTTIFEKLGIIRYNDVQGYIDDGYTIDPWVPPVLDGTGLPFHTIKIVSDTWYLSPWAGAKCEPWGYYTHVGSDSRWPYDWSYTAYDAAVDAGEPGIYGIGTLYFALYFYQIFKYDEVFYWIITWWAGLGPVEVVNDWHLGGEFPWGDPQTRTITNISSYGEWYYFEDYYGNSGGGQGSNVIEQALSESWIMSEEAYGVYSYSSSATESASWSEEIEPWTNDCCTLRNPVDCLPNDVFPNFEKWIIISVTFSAVEVSDAYSPCYHWEGWPHSYRPSGPHTIPSYIDVVTFSEEIRFDDGHVETLGAGNPVDYDNEPNSADCAVYNWSEEPIYVGSYLYAGSAKDCIVFYYYKGEFKSSARFKNNQDWNFMVDAFDSVKNYGGYWDGQVRVGKLEETKIEKEL